MPPRISFSRTDILNSALDVVRESGIESLTVRKVAEKMKGSTQPIYREFGTMEELEECVLRAAKEISLQYMLQAEDEESSFLAVGMGYIEFAKKEPGLFRLLYMSGITNHSYEKPDWPFDKIIAKMQKDHFLKNLDRETLKQLLMDMRTFTHGLCTMAHSSSDSSDSGTLRQLVHDMGEKLIMFELLKAGGKINPENLKRRWKNEIMCP
jgi:AcrR family transcriptional regulator